MSNYRQYICSNIFNIRYFIAVVGVESFHRKWWQSHARSQGTANASIIYVCIRAGRSPTFGLAGTPIEQVIWTRTCSCRLANTRVPLPALVCIQAMALLGPLWLLFCLINCPDWLTVPLLLVIEYFVDQIVTPADCRSRQNYLNLFMKFPQHMHNVLASFLQHGHAYLSTFIEYHIHWDSG